ncbi:unnamed protein product [Protopolystoma xenopodis]|uniref:Uncharacterized protein n=1 Tax=Protopolystoma xenopodis TaxID=117903 RepID=A0A448XDI3_9PLAT|nr:unnamed protein product [Protopolystoma xenopodis]
MGSLCLVGLRNANQTQRPLTTPLASPVHHAPLSSTAGAAVINRSSIHLTAMATPQPLNPPSIVGTNGTTSCTTNQLPSSSPPRTSVHPSPAINSGPSTGHSFSASRPSYVNLASPGTIPFTSGAFVANTSSLLSAAPGPTITMAPGGTVSSAGRLGLTEKDVQILSQVFKMIISVSRLVSEIGPEFEASLSLLHSLAQADVRRTSLTNGEYSESKENSSRTFFQDADSCSTLPARSSASQVFLEETDDLLRRVRTVLLSTAEMRQHQDDPERLVDLHYSLARSYASNPALRRDSCA